MKETLCEEIFHLKRNSLVHVLWVNMEHLNILSVQLWGRYCRNTQLCSISHTHPHTFKTKCSVVHIPQHYAPYKLSLPLCLFTTPPRTRTRQPFPDGKPFSILHVLTPGIWVCSLTQTHSESGPLM